MATRNSRQLTGLHEPHHPLYLERLGLSAEPPSAEALIRLHRAHVERIPYDTFWIHLDQPWTIEPAEAAQRIATTRRGGYCYQLNGALYTILKDLGYTVTMNVSGVYGPDGPNEDTMRSHTTLIVEDLPTPDNPGGRWWVDVGLCDALYDPLPLVEGTYVQGPMHFELERVRNDPPVSLRLMWCCGIGWVRLLYA